jgi:hypothetical protein
MGRDCPKFVALLGRCGQHQVGATDQAAAVLGGGVSLMTGGFRNSFALQRISVTGNS